MHHSSAYHKTQHNNGMHPTPQKRASHARWAGARVMPGVRRLLAKHEDERFGVASRAGNQLRLAGGAW
jgi:hypothetical protein